MQEVKFKEDYILLKKKYNLQNNDNLYINFPTNADSVFQNFLNNINVKDKKHYINYNYKLNIDITIFYDLYIYFIDQVNKAKVYINNSNLKYLCQPLNEWNFCIYDNMMFNFPFTLSNIIFIPITYLQEYSKKLSDKFINTLIHEKIHIFQRKNHNFWQNYIIELDVNWILISNDNEIFDIITDFINNNTIILNPDTFYNFKYIYKKNNNFYIGLLIKNNISFDTQWFLIDLINKSLIKINNKIVEHEHPYEYYAYKFSNEIINI